MTTAKTNTLGGECIAELLGTFLFLFIGMGCVAGLKLSGASYGQWEISIIWGLAVACGAYLTAGVSGAHLNPAVTVAFWLFGNFDRRKVLPFIGAQMLGGLCAAALTFSLYHSLFIETETTLNMVRGSQESLSLAGIFSTYPYPTLGFFQAALVEIVITAILLALIFALTDDGNGVPRGPLAPLLIGVVVAIIGASFGPLTGFAMNPARDFAPKVFAWLAGWGEIAFTGGKDIPYFLVPLIAPLIGGCVGAFIYKRFIASYLPAKSK